MRYIIPLIVVSFALFGLDYYVYRNWRRFARASALRWTLPIYRVGMWIMPVTLPLYLSLFSWWEVEPRLARALFFGFWAIYYVPKVPIALVLLVKDAVRFARRLNARTATRRSADSERDGAAVVGSQARAESTLTRGEFLRRLGWSAATVPFVATGYGVFRTLYDFSVLRVDVPIAGLPRAFDGMTIAQLSDLHAGSLFSDAPMREAVEIVNRLRPDLVVLTGDYVNHDVAETPLILPSLNDLQADLGVYGCLGNHDHYADTNRLVDQIGSTPVDLLINAHRTLEIDGARLHVIGTDNTGFRQHYADLPQAVSGIEPGGESARILLAHDPTFWDHEVRPGYEDIDLMVCGHTHGGQFGIEMGPLRWSLAQVRYDRWAGLYREPRAGGGEQFLYVNRGIGTVGPPLRLGIPPEITLLTLRRA